MGSTWLMTTRARSSFALIMLPECTRRPPVRPEIGAAIWQYETFKRAVSTAASSAFTVAFRASAFAVA